VVDDLEAARKGDALAFERLVAPHRRELRAHCYRMSGSLHDADDLLQETLLRAWKGLGGFEGRAAFRTWLYRVSTHACIDALDKHAGRALPPDLGPAHDPGRPYGPPSEQPIFLDPCPASFYEPEPAETSSSPEARYGERESVAFAFLVVLQNLPPKQRAVLLLRDVIGESAEECARTLDLTVAAVNSALQRARDALAHRERKVEPAATPSAVLARWVSAWHSSDASALVALLREDATLAMPPMSEWLLGATAIGAAIDGMVFTPAGPGAFRLVPIEVSGLPGFLAYARGPDGAEKPMAIHALDIDSEAGKIRGVVAFLRPDLFPIFGG
jgi:RNA polymerase sigma-70 factor, ECF subfamily